jgi:hypothetical protein
LIPIRLISAAIAGLMNSILDIPALNTIIDLKTLSYLRLAAAELQGFGEKGVRLPGAPNTKDAPASLLASDNEPKKKNVFNAMLDSDKIQQEIGESMQEVKDNTKDISDGQKKEKECETNLHLDGKKVAKNQARHQQDLSDRMGFQTPPFIRRTAASQGRVGN